ncbi:FxSxx-COOH system tetratricopeptide repeat protein [Streptomyces pseudovenezuelae]|uniref:FxSxx-COOH system tetratricopeptide repeat protein n=1 Tax=Streptomyces pseudovenezuelae TaxID=67350 RepID=UPI0036E0D9A4
MSGEGNGRIVTFYSYKGGTGRTMALANAAWILASGGQRVLAVDWDLDAPGLDRFLHPFLDQEQLRTKAGVLNLFSSFSQAVTERLHLQKQQATAVDEGHPGEEEAAWVAEQARFNHCVIPVNWQFPGRGQLDFISAGAQNSQYLAAFSQFNWMPFWDGWHGPRLLQALREELCQHYDYVLVDSRTGLNDVSDICTVMLPHVLVVCFTPSSQGIDGAHAVASKIDGIYGYRNIRIVPVLTRVEDANGEADRLEATRQQVRSRFAETLRRHHSDRDPLDYWGKAEIPYRPSYAYEEMLAPFRDAPGSHSSMLAACERLTGIISDGEVTSLTRIDEGVRQHQLELYKRQRPLGNSDVYLSFVPEDRTWADWIAHVLRTTGFRVHLAPSGTVPGRLVKDETEQGVDSAFQTVAVLSNAYLRSDQARTVWEKIASIDSLGSRRSLIPVKVDDVRVSAPYSERQAADLVACGADEAQAAEALLRALDAATPSGVHPATTDGDGPRYPGAEPPVWLVPLRTTAFTGRAGMMEDLREQLRRGSGTVLLRGMGGAGKTLLAQEFAHRFRGDYDVVWHIQADQRNLAVEQYAWLAPKIGVQERKNPTDTAAAVRDALRRGLPYHRWLLILDNAEGPESLTDLLVSGGSGHVIVTSQRSEGWDRHAEIVEVGVFDRGESITHLRNRLPECTVEEADAVAEALGDLPLAVEQAAAALKESGIGTEEYVSQLQNQPAADTEGISPDDQLLDVSQAWRVAIAQLSKNYPPAVQLLRLASWFSPEPISFDLLQSTEISRALRGGSAVLDSTQMISRGFQELNRYSLAKVDRRSQSLQVHRLVQMSVRASMTEEDQRATSEAVYRTLVAARPEKDDPEDHHTWERYRIIWPHLGTPWALSTRTSGIRKLIVDRVRQLRRRGELKQALDLSRRVLTEWSKPQNGGRDERWALHMEFQIANILRAQGRYTESLAIDQDVLRRQRETLKDEDDLHILMTAGSNAADLRGLGRFTDALAYDRQTRRKFIELYGDDHQRSLLASSNLAVSLRLSGQYYEALELDQSTLETRESIFGTNHTNTIESAINHGRDLCDCGEYDKAVRQLRSTYKLCLEDPGYGESSPITHNAAKALTVSLRRAGLAAEAEELTRRVLEAMGDEEGRASPERLLLELSLAGDLAAQGRAQEAADLARMVLAGCQRPEGFGELHPHTIACMTNYAVYLYAAGEAAVSLTCAEQAAAAFESIFGEDHLFGVMCRVNVANAQASLGNRAAARTLYEEAYDRLRESLKPDHPATLVCSANMAILLDELHEETVADAKRQETLGAMTRRLGADHPYTVALREWNRSGLELDPHPI